MRGDDRGGHLEGQKALAGFTLTEDNVITVLPLTKYNKIIKILI
jgi:hypothetical protein